MASTQPPQSGKPPGQGPDKESTSSSSAQLSLPAPTDISAPASTVPTDAIQSFKLDALGPMVLNSDGTLSRIHNWSEMTQVERERTLRILGKRNQLRRENILASEGE